VFPRNKENIPSTPGGHMWLRTSLAEMRKLVEAPDWLSEAFKDKLTCYDLNLAIRKWLKDTGNEDKSVCEVLQAEGFKEHTFLGQALGHYREGGQAPKGLEGRPAVGEAQAFQSHVQSESPYDLFTAMSSLSIGKAGTKPGAAIWVDSFSLRQCASNEFSPAEVVSLIGEIGATYAVIDGTTSYATRTFCVLESYATVHTGARLEMVKSKPEGCGSFIGLVTDYCCCYVCTAYACPIKVDSANAQTRSKKDKALIDDYVRESVGFAVLDETMEREIHKGRISDGMTNAFCLWGCPIAFGVFVGAQVGVCPTDNLPEWCLTDQFRNVLPGFD